MQQPLGLWNGPYNETVVAICAAYVCKTPPAGIAVTIGTGLDESCGYGRIWIRCHVEIDGSVTTQIFNVTRCPGLPKL